MVFIKLIKSIDSKKEGCNSKCYFLHVKVCGNFLILVQSDSIHILEGTAVVQYFIDYRLNYNGTYSLNVPLVSNYKLKGKYYSEIDVDIKNMQIESQMKKMATKNIEVKDCANGKKKSLQLSCLKVSKSINNEESILIVRQPTKIEFINYQKCISYFVIDFKQIIISSGWRQSNQLVILNELNELSILDVFLGESCSSFVVVKKFNLNCFEQIFLCLVGGNIIFGEKFALELTSEMELRNFTVYKGNSQIFQGEMSQNLINQESKQIRLSNMKVIQLENDSWAFIRNKNENLISLNNQEYYGQLLKNYEVTYLTISHFQYARYNKINEMNKKYIVIYRIMCLCAQQSIGRNTEKFMIFFQSIESSNPSNHVLIPFMKLVDFKDELIYAEFLSPYDLIFHDCKGSVGIVQFTVMDLGEKQL